MAAYYTKAPTAGGGKKDNNLACRYSEIKTLNQHPKAGGMAYYCCHLLIRLPGGPR